jgi:catechol-2,3-dioxygenase
VPEKYFTILLDDIVTYNPGFTSFNVAKPTLMKIRLQEIEFGAGNTDKSKGFYQSVLGLDPVIDQDQLKVFNSGVAGVDFNISEHQPSKTVVTSFLTNDLQKLVDRLVLTGVLYEGPVKSHLGMMSVSFQDPDGNMIKVNQPTAESPSWLKV